MKLSTLVLAATLAGVHSTHLRRPSAHVQQANELTSHPTRHLLGESSCTLYKSCATFAATKEHPQGYHKDTWTCKLEGGVANRIHADYVEIVQTPETVALLASAVSGESMLAFTEAIADTKKSELYIPEESRFDVHTPDVRTPDASVLVVAAESGADVHNMLLEESALELKPTQPLPFGKKKVLMIRVIDNGGNGMNEPDKSTNQLHDEIFGEGLNGDGLTFKTQVDACSYSQFQVEPFEGKAPNQKVQIQKGVVEVIVDNAVAGDPDFGSMARQAAKAQLGDLDDPSIDLVMYCFPPGMAGPTAWAYARN